MLGEIIVTSRICETSENAFNELRSETLCIKLAVEFMYIVSLLGIERSRTYYVWIEREILVAGILNRSLQRESKK